MVDINLSRLAYVSLFSFFCTFCLVPIFSFLASKINLIDTPDGKIKKHDNPVPYLGGVAVYFGFLCGLIFSFSFTKSMFFLVFGTTPLLFLGLMDDVISLKPYKKFLGQFFITIFLLGLSMSLHEQLFHNYWHVPIFIVWVLTVVNAFNLVDVMDGLATVTALGATSSYFSIAMIHNNAEIALPLSSFGGALIAFLWYNRPPAQIYLGDAGSLWIGGFLAITPLFFNWNSYNAYGYLTPVFILGIALLEVVSLIIIRSYKGLPFYLGSPHHFCHYLRSNGWSKRLILLYVVAISVILNVVACLYVQGVITLPILISICFLLLSIWLLFLILPLQVFLFFI